MRPLQVLLVDDSLAFIEAAERFLLTDAHFQIVGRARTGREAMDKVAELHPDLVIMDWVMPEMPGLVALRRIKAQANAPRIIILTMYDNAEYREIADLAHADGFVAKSDFGRKLIPLIYNLFNTLPQPLNSVAVK